METPFVFISNSRMQNLTVEVRWAWEFYDANPRPAVLFIQGR